MTSSLTVTPANKTPFVSATIGATAGACAFAAREIGAQTKILSNPDCLKLLNERIGTENINSASFLPFSFVSKIKSKHLINLKNKFNNIINYKGFDIKSIAKKGLIGAVLLGAFGFFIGILKSVGNKEQ